MARATGILSSFVLVAGLAGALSAQDPANTGKNKRDRAEHAVTADQQGESEADRELARKIREELVADKSLSLNAHNSKVIVRDGKVILRGPVNSDAEKTKIAAIAARHAGDNMVENKLEVKNSKGNKDNGK